MIRFQLSRWSSERPVSVPRRRRRGQTLVEFALTLPILLLLMFGIVEFGRIFQAWVTVQNAARDAARFAITGNYDQNLFPAMDADGKPDLSLYTWEPQANNILSGDTKHGLPCPLHPTTTGYSSVAATAGIETDDMRIFGDELRNQGGQPNNSAAFQSHWDGIACDPNDEVDQGLQKDIPRLVSIAKQAQIGASGLSVNPGLRIPGTDINTELSPDASSQPGWFHVYMCSSRLQFAKNTAPGADPTKPRYHDGMLDASPQRVCGIVEPDPTINGVHYAGLNQPNGPRNQYDAGGPGDFVHVVVFFNHPLLTPISFNSVPGGNSAPLSPQGYIQLQASRTMINEAFRYHTLITLPDNTYQLTPDTPAPGTPTATNTPNRTNTPTDTNTPLASPTPSNTATNTPAPTCSGLVLASYNLVNDSLQLNITNNNLAPVYISGAMIVWGPRAQHVDNGQLFVSTLQVVGYQPFWNYTGSPPGLGTGSYTLPPMTTNGSNGWQVSSPIDSKLQIEGSNSRSIHISFGPTGAPPLQQNLAPDDFGGTALTFNLAGAAPGNWPPCSLSLNLATPPAPTSSPTVSTPPSCSASEFSLAFVTFQNNGQVQFQFTNNTRVPVYISSFTIYWGKYAGMALTEVDLNGADAFTRPPAIQLWSGNSTSSPTSSLAGTWRAKGSVFANSTTNFWAVFSGRAGLMPGQPSDFNGTTLTLDNGCTVTEQALATPIPTRTIGPTRRPTLTSTATRTVTRTSTPTPSKTYMPSTTFTPSRTFTPSTTFTPSKTYTPTATFTPSITFTPSNTPTVPDTTVPAANAPLDISTPLPTSTPLPMPTYNGMGD